MEAAQEWVSATPSPTLSSQLRWNPLGEGSRGDLRGAAEGAGVVLPAEKEAQGGPYRAL